MCVRFALRDSCVRALCTQVPVLNHSTNGTTNDKPTVLVPPTHQPVYLPHGVVPPHPLNSTVPFEPAVALQLLVPQPPPEWLAATDLVKREDGKYRQSDQSPEIQACLSAAVQRANANLVFISGFPDPLTKRRWLTGALKMELGERRKGSATIAIVDDRARDDERYFSRLQSMVTYSVVAATWQLMSLPQITGRWSGFRQGVIDKARELIDSEESTYRLWRDPTDHYVDPEEVRQAARDLLTKDAYHFRKTAAVRSRIQRILLSLTLYQGTIDTAAPYQHPEFMAALAYYFKGRDAVGVLFKEQMPNGDHGPQVPDAMVALTATAVGLCPSAHGSLMLTHSRAKIQVALQDTVEGGPSPFSEKSYRDKYQNHLHTINTVKNYGDRGLRYARMMSNIYQGTK